MDTDFVAMRPFYPAPRLRPSSRILSSFSSTPWAILPDKLAEISAFLRLASTSGLDEHAIRAEAPRPEPQRVESVAVLPVFGTIFPRANVMSDFSGGTSLEILSKRFRAFLSDPSVSAIVLDVDSPGGAVAGVQEFAEEVFAARATKRIVAVADTMAASAAYWIASAASEFVASPGSEVGSIGVILEHVDWTKANEESGLKVTLLSAGKYKTTGSPDLPLDETSTELLQGLVDRAYKAFTDAVARYRGVSGLGVRNGFGEGFVVGAAEAKRLGMVDRVETMADTLDRLTRRRSRAARAAAARIRFASARIAERRKA